MEGKGCNARAQGTKCSQKELSFVRGIISEKEMGSADLEVCLARLKSVEQRPSWWIQLRMTQLTSSVDRIA